jgi:hypothetical protein
LSKSAHAGPIRLALNIEDRAMADRLTALLANVPGLRLVGASESADVALVPTTVVSATADGDVLLTPRELEVLTLRTAHIVSPVAEPRYLAVLLAPLPIALRSEGTLATA